MNLLREYIRELLTERAMGVEDVLKARYYVVVSEDASSFEIKLYKNDPRPALGKARLPYSSIGVIAAEKPAASRGLGCLGAYEVVWSNAEEASGYGPLLYDLAMELATSKGSGIMADRHSVSDDAFRVWKYYANRRPDVEVIQLDDLDDRLTPGEPSDNCDQKNAYKDDRDGLYWHDWSGAVWDPRGKEVLLKSPRTKMYRSKGTPKIEALRKVGRWVRCSWGSESTGGC